MAASQTSEQVSSLASPMSPISLGLTPILTSYATDVLIILSSLTAKVLHTFAAHMKYHPFQHQGLEGSQLLEQAQQQQ